MSSTGALSYLPQAGVAAVYMKLEEDDAAGAAAAAGAAGDLGSVADQVVAQLGAALLFVSEGVRWGEGPQLASVAVRMLPSLMRLQVCACLSLP